jgi:hypothetical protein
MMIGTVAMVICLATPMLSAKSPTLLPAFLRPARLSSYLVV